MAGNVKLEYYVIIEIKNIKCANTSEVKQTYHYLKKFYVSNYVVVKAVAAGG